MLWLTRIPLFVALMFICAVAMLVPAGFAATSDEHKIAQHFFYAALMLGCVSGLLALALRGKGGTEQPRDLLATMLATMVVLPLMLAVPFAQSLPDTGLFNGWWEMVSAITTTGASLYKAEMLPDPLHLWRAIVGWMGGLFILITALAVLAPLKLGGFEIMSSPYGRNEQFARLPARADGSQRDIVQHGRSGRGSTQRRLIRAAVLIFPLYAGLTVALWVGLLMAGDAPLVALCRAMGTLATSGISPVSGPIGSQSGLGGELLVFLFLLPALSRRFWPGAGELRASEHWRQDPELRIGLAIVALVAGLLFTRHFFGALGLNAAGPPMPGMNSLGNAAAAAWGGIFNAISYLTTTGWNSSDWQGARAWSGMSSPGLMLAGLAIMGGGVATTAGGVKLLRVYALARQGERELDRMIHPSSVAGGGRMARRLRRDGAFLSFIFFMLFAMSIAVSVSLVSIHPIEFETAVILSISALTNTGPLAATIPLTPSFEGSAGIASAPWDGWSGLAPFVKAVLAGVMVVGRLETLAILALFSPEFWRR